MEKCSFCGRLKNEVKHLIQSTVNKSAFICERCAVVCKGLLKDDEKRREEGTPPPTTA